MPATKTRTRTSGSHTAVTKAPAKRKRKKKTSIQDKLTIVLLLLLLVAMAIMLYKNYQAHADIAAVQPGESQSERQSIFDKKDKDRSKTQDTPEVTEKPVEPTPTPEPEYVFAPHCVESTDPAKLISETGIMVNGETVESYTSPYEPISFGDGSEYTELEGVITFRGDNYRSGASYGTRTISAGKFGEGWSVTTGSLSDNQGNVWTGSGWTGQPLVVRWPKETRAVMTSMYDWAREKDDLAEVIYATMDGYIYFLELQTGKQTRDRMNMGLTYKGTGALDPRGYPILYVGSGVRNLDGKSHVSVINLITCKVMYEFGDKDGFALRDWPMFDSSPLVDAETDQLIYPGENGILYIIHLNTKYDASTGELSIDPDNVVKWRYNGVRTTRFEYWLGMESSAAILQGHIFMCDNGGNMMCLDLNTLELVWVQDILDDSNSTPLISFEDGHPYIYVSTSFHDGWRGYNTQTIPIWKLDAETGEIVWQVDYTCHTDSGVSGGVQGTMAMDDECIYVPVAKTGTAAGGVLAAIKKDTGEKKWEFKSGIYSWGSPILFTDTAGKEYVIYNTGYGESGYIYLIDAETGTQLDSRNLNGNIEASGVVFDNYLVIGHRRCRIFGVPLT